MSAANNDMQIFDACKENQAFGHRPQFERTIKSTTTTTNMPHLAVPLQHSQARPQPPPLTINPEIWPMVKESINLPSLGASSPGNHTANVSTDFEILEDDMSESAYPAGSAHAVSMNGHVLQQLGPADLNIKVGSHGPLTAMGIHRPVPAAPVGPAAPIPTDSVIETTEMYTVDQSSFDKLNETTYSRSKPGIGSFDAQDNSRQAVNISPVDQLIARLEKATAEPARLGCGSSITNNYSVLRHQTSYPTSQPSTAAGYIVAGCGPHQTVTGACSDRDQQSTSFAHNSPIAHTCLHQPVPNPFAYKLLNSTHSASEQHGNRRTLRENAIIKAYPTGFVQHGTVSFHGNHQVDTLSDIATRGFHSHEENNGQVCGNPSPSQETLLWKGPNDHMLAPGMSRNYKGNPFLQANQSADIPDELNCSLWITNLPTTCTIHSLLTNVRGCGKVYATVINPPDYHKGHLTSAAKLVFFSVDGARALLQQARLGLFIVNGYVPKVVYNRVKTAAQKPCPECRVIHVEGPSQIVNVEYLSNWFTLTGGFTYEVDSINLLSESQTGGWRRLEWQFGSFRCQAAAAVMRIEQERRNIDVGDYEQSLWRQVTVYYGVDPCA
jgi:hypothetical protein